MKYFTKNEINDLLKNSIYYNKMLTKGKKIPEGVEILAIDKNSLGRKKGYTNKIVSNTMVVILCAGKCGKEKILPFQHLISNICLYCKSCKYKNVSQTMTGRHHSKETKLKISRSHQGFKHSEETRRKMSIAKKGENHPNWKGGKGIK